MTCNVGGTDKMIRIILGLVVLGLGIAYSSWWALLGAVLLLTGIFNFCPAYKLLGISTCEEHEAKK